MFCDSVGCFGIVVEIDWVVLVEVYDCGYECVLRYFYDDL